MSVSRGSKARAHGFPSSLLTHNESDLISPPLFAESHYKEKLQHRCCKDGLRAVPMPYSCTRRSYYITEGWECIRAFRYCCSTYRDEAFDTEIPTTPPPTTTTPPTTSAPRPTFAFHFAFADVVPVLRTHVRDSAPGELFTDLQLNQLEHSLVETF